MSENFKQSFSIIKHYNSPNDGETQYGQKVRREEKLFFQGRFIQCAPYSEHFLYDDKYGPWTPMCTCGGYGGIVGYNAYKKDASPTDTGEMIVCVIHAETGRHADGVG